MRVYTCIDTHVHICMHIDRYLGTNPTFDLFCRLRGSFSFCPSKRLP